MSWALRDEASIETAISSRRLPSPIAATSHVFNRIESSARLAALKRAASTIVIRSRLLRSLNRSASGKDPRRDADTRAVRAATERSQLSRSDRDSATKCRKSGIDPIARVGGHVVYSLNESLARDARTIGTRPARHLDRGTTAALAAGILRRRAHPGARQPRTVHPRSR